MTAFRFTLLLLHLLNVIIVFVVFVIITITTTIIIVIRSVATLDAGLARWRALP